MSEKQFSCSVACWMFSFILNQSPWQPEQSLPLWRSFPVAASHCDNWKQHTEVCVHVHQSAWDNGIKKKMRQYQQIFWHTRKIELQTNVQDNVFETNASCLTVSILLRLLSTSRTSGASKDNHRSPWNCRHWQECKPLTSHTRWHSSTNDGTKAIPGHRNEM